MEGYLEKCDARFRNWNMRYFLLVNNVLYYFATEEDRTVRDGSFVGSPKGEIRLDNCICRIADVKYQTDMHMTGGRRTSIIICKTKPKRTIANQRYK